MTTERKRSVRALNQMRHFCWQLAAIALYLSFPVAHAEKQQDIGAKEILLLHKLGYGEAQLRATVIKAKRAGKLALTTRQVLALRRAGLSIGFIRWLGIKAPTTRHAKIPRRQTVPKLPWELRLPPPNKSPKRASPTHQKRKATTARKPTLRSTSKPRRPPTPKVHRSIPPPRVVPPSPMVKQLMGYIVRALSMRARTSAVKRLGALGPRATYALPMLVRILQLPPTIGASTTYQLKQATLWSIGQMGPYAMKAAPYLLANLRKPLLQTHALRSLDKLMLQTSVSYAPQLAKMLRLWLQRAKWWQIKALAARHLGYLGATAAPAVPALQQALQPMKPNYASHPVRKYAAIALGNIGKAATPALLALAKRFHDPQAGAEAKRAFEQILQQNPRAIRFMPALLANSAMPTSARLLALQKLLDAGKVTQALLPQLIAAMAPTKSNPLRLRIAAIKAIGQLKANAMPALPQLRRALRVESKLPNSAELRIAAARCIGAIGPSAIAAIAPLLRCFQDQPSVRHAARTVLDRLIVQPAKHWHILQRALVTKDPMIQIYAASQLLRMKFDPTVQSTPQRQKQLEAIKQSSLIPAAYWSWGAYELAARQQRQNQAKHAVRTLIAAVKMGFDDHLVFILSPLWQTFITTTAYPTLLKHIKSRPTDRRELLWLKREQAHIKHDTKMMIIEQMGRKDSAWTIVPQSKIPTSTTPSHAVLINRMLTKRLQQRQKSTILRSDISRRSHVSIMAMGRNMGGKQSVAQRNFALRARLLSQRQALMRAKTRRLQIQRRRYKPQPAPQTPDAPPVLTQPPKQTKPTQTKRRLQRVQHLIKQKRWRAAMSLLNALQRQRPNALLLHRLKASIEIARKRYAAALTALDQAIALAPKMALLYIVRSNVQFLQQRFAASKRDAVTAQNLAPRGPLVFAALNNIAAIEFQRDQPQRALPLLQKANKYKPHNPVIQANIALTLLRMGHIARAKRWIQLARHTKPNDNFVLYTSACIYAATDRWGIALETLRNAMRRGFQLHWMPAKEPNFNALRKTPAFRSVLAP